MDEPNFCRWLQGFCELQADDTPPTKEQWAQIKQHLQLVYYKVSPEMIEILDKAKQACMSVEEQNELTEAVENIKKDIDKKWKDSDKKQMPFCLPVSNKICSSTEK